MVVQYAAGNIYLNESGKKFLVVVKKSDIEPYWVVKVSNYEKVIWQDLLSASEIEREFPIRIGEGLFRKYNPDIDLDALKSDA